MRDGERHVEEYSARIVTVGNQRFFVFGVVAIPVETTVEQLTDRVALAVVDDYLSTEEKLRTFEESIRRKKRWKERCCRMASSANGKSFSDSQHSWRKWAENRRMSVSTARRVGSDRCYPEEVFNESIDWDGFSVKAANTTNGRATYHLPRSAWRRWSNNKGTNLVKRMRRLTCNGKDDKQSDGEGDLQLGESTGLQMCFDWS